MGVNVMTGVVLPGEELSGCECYDRCLVTGVSLPSEGLSRCEYYERCLVTRSGTEWV